jgi:DNA-binding beta-propeller fold protein YncE
MAAALNSDKGSQYLYIANADLDRLALVDVTQRSLLLDPSPATPGIYMIKTGRYPVSVATTPDQKKMYVLHGIEGNLGVVDLTKFQEVQDGNAALRLPKACSTNTCWQNPSQLMLYNDETNKRLLGFVAIPSEQSIAVVNLTDGDAKYGEEIQRFRVQGTPGRMFRATDGKTIYITNSKRQQIAIDNTKERQLAFFHAIDAEALTMQNVKLCETVFDKSTGGYLAPPCGATQEGAVSQDGRWLYFIDMATGGIRVYDWQEKKTVKQGDARFPENETIRVPGGTSFLGIMFMPAMAVTIKDASGNDKEVTKTLAWATGSDGYVYAIDTETHTLLDTDETDPSVANLQMFVGPDSAGDPRDPVRNTLPKLAVTSGQDNDTGIKVFPGKTRSEIWTLTYEGVVVSGRSGRFSDLKNGLFLDAESRDLSLDTVQVGDILSLHDCVPGTGQTTDGGTTDGSSEGTPCELTITEVNRHQLTVDIKDATIPERSSWTYSIRSKAGTFLVQGTLSGTLQARLEQGKTYTADSFSLKINKGTEATPRDTRIGFTTDSGVVVGRVALLASINNRAGLPRRLLSLASHNSCANQCSVESCQSHPSCTKTQCVAGSTEETKQCPTSEDCISGTCVPQQRIWILDPSSSQLYVVNPKTRQLENTIR